MAPSVHSASDGQLWEKNDAVLKSPIFAFNASAPAFVPEFAEAALKPHGNFVLNASDHAGDSGKPLLQRGRRRGGSGLSSGHSSVVTSPLLTLMGEESEIGGISSNSVEDRPRPAARGRRASSNAESALSQASTLVIKNLALDLEKSVILRHLEERSIAPCDIEFHLDAAGMFRGTAFVRYLSPGKAKDALEKLGTCPELGGRKARLEIQKSKSLIGRRSIEAELPAEALGVVREGIEAFLSDDSLLEVNLSSTFNVQQRKYAHSLAERHSLVHVTKQGPTGEKFVHLSKHRRILQSQLRERATSYSLGSPMFQPDMSPFARSCAMMYPLGSRSVQHTMSASPFSDEALFLEGAPGLPPPMLPLPSGLVSPAQALLCDPNSLAPCFSLGSPLMPLLEPPPGLEPTFDQPPPGLAPPPGITCLSAAVQRVE